jgi:hypothetical protein
MGVRGVATPCFAPSSAEALDAHASVARIDAEAQNLGIALVHSDGNDGNIDSAPCVDIKGMSRAQLSKRHFRNTTRTHFAMRRFHGGLSGVGGATSIVTKLAWNCHATLIAEGPR